MRQTFNYKSKVNIIDLSATTDNNKVGGLCRYFQNIKMTKINFTLWVITALNKSDVDSQCILFSGAKNKMVNNNALLNNV